MTYSNSVSNSEEKGDLIFIQIVKQVLVLVLVVYIVLDCMTSLSIELLCIVVAVFYINFNCIHYSTLITHYMTSLTLYRIY